MSENNNTANGRVARYLPDGFVQEGLKIAKGAVIFGVRLDDLSRDELLASAAHGWEAYRRQLEQGKRDIDVICGLQTKR